MVDLLSTLLPLCLAATLSPVLLTEQLLILGRSGARSGLAYLAGVVVVLAAATAVALVVGTTLQLPGRPRLSAQTDIGLGAALIVLGVAARLLGLRRRPSGAGHPAPKKTKKASGDSPVAAFTLAVGSMAADFTTLALVLVAAKDIASSRADLLTLVVAVLMLLVFGSLPAWLPLLVTAVSPRRGLAALQGLSAFVTKHGRTIVLILVVAVGVYLVVRGIVRLG